MSQLIATVSRVQSLDSLNIVSFDLGGMSLKMMSLDLDEKVIIGVNVSLNIKAISVAIAKDFTGELSYSNKIESKIESMQNGELLCSLNLSAQEMVFESIITQDSASRMELKVGDTVTALIKANDISILEILS